MCRVYGRAHARGSFEVALAFGRPLIVESGGAAFALRTILSVSGTAFALLRRLSMLVRDRRMFCRAFALTFGLVMLLRRRDGVGLGFLAMSGGLAAKALALALALAAVHGHPPGREQNDGDHDYDADDDGDHCNG